jgi:curli biogenesis system outer membrane secretion channel CsgG
VGNGQGGVSCDLRLIEVANGSGVASASGDSAPGRLVVLAKELAGKLKDGVPARGSSVAVVTLRNRSGTPRGKVMADELADKVQGALIDTGWFDVKERIDLRGVLNERDLDTAGVVRNEDVRKHLVGVKYIVIGGVTVTEAENKP